VVPQGKEKGSHLKKQEVIAFFTKIKRDNNEKRRGHYAVNRMFYNVRLFKVIDTLTRGRKTYCVMRGSRTFNRQGSRLMERGQIVEKKKRKWARGGGKGSFKKDRRPSGKKRCV